MSVSPKPAPAAIGAVLEEDESMLDPKWYVIGASAALFVLLANYSPMFGIAAGVVIALILVLRVSLWFWLAPERGAPASERGAMVERFRRLSDNRRLARVKEMAAKARPKLRRQS